MCSLPIGTGRGPRRTRRPRKVKFSSGQAPAKGCFPIHWVLQRLQREAGSRPALADYTRGPITMGPVTLFHQLLLHSSTRGAGVGGATEPLVRKRSLSGRSTRLENPGDRTLSCETDCTGRRPGGVDELIPDSGVRFWRGTLSYISWFLGPDPQLNPLDKYEECFGCSRTLGRGQIARFTSAWVLVRRVP